MAKLEQVVQQEQEEHDALQQAKRDSPFAGLEIDAEQEPLKIERQRENEEATPPERELKEAAPGEETPAEDEPKPDPEGKALFDRSSYEREDLAIPKVDGQAVDKIRVKFSGSVMLDRSEPADVALYNRLTLGKEVELRCAGKVSGTGVGWTTNRDGDLDAIVGERSLKVETVWVLDPEELV